MKKKPTPVAKAVDEIEKRKVNAPTISARIWNDALNEAIAIIEEQKGYERECFGDTYQDGLSDGIYNKEYNTNTFDNYPHFDTTYTQEGGQS